LDLDSIPDIGNIFIPAGKQPALQPQLFILDEMTAAAAAQLIADDARRELVAVVPADERAT